MDTVARRKAVVKMGKPGTRPITLPDNHREPYGKGLSAANPQTSRSQPHGEQHMRLKINIHHDGAEYWSEIAELPGCFASGRTMSELHEALAEAIGLYLWDEPGRDAAK
jgi:predicted RNase H-like HicB family nuclease